MLLFLRLGINGTPREIHTLMLNILKKYASEEDSFNLMYVEEFV